MEKIKWKWKPKRWWLTLIGIWIVYQIIIISISFSIVEDLFADSLVYDTEFAKDIDSTLVGFYNFVYLGFIILLAASDRNFKTTAKVFWIIGMFIAYTVLSILIALSGLVGHSLIGLTNFKLYFLASFPLYIISMRRSSIFIEKDTGHVK